MRARTKATIGVGLAAAGAVLFAGPAGAETPLAPLADFEKSVNLLWVVIGAVLVIFMQAGFAMVETGFCRAKHAAHVVATNFAIFGLGFVGFFLVGYGLMFGGYTLPLVGYNTAVGTHLVGSGNWVLLWGGGWAGSGKAFYTAGAMGFFLYMVAFMDTTATIPTGAMAERWKWKAFVGWGLFCGALYYPIFGAWTWGGGWLAKLGDSMNLGVGYVDFAGSGVVHAMGGVAGLAGALVLGPRLGKFNKDKTPNTLPGHHVPMAMLGCFILLFGWFGFNAASTFAATDIRFAVVALNTALAAAFGATAAMFYVTKKWGKPDPGMMVNGMLAGLVAITAPCAFVQPWAAALIGVIAGVLVIEAAIFIEKKGVDDPVGAIAVHGVCGIFGVLAVGIFADGQYGGTDATTGLAWNATKVNTGGVTGILYGGDGFKQFIAQAIGAVVICTVMFGIAYAFFSIQNKLIKGGIRSEEADELIGLDMPEMGMLAYPEFVEQDAITLNAGGSPTHEETQKVDAPA